MSYFDIMRNDEIITDADKKFIEDIWYNQCEFKKSVIKKHEKLIPSIFNAMSALSIKGIESEALLILIPSIRDDYSNNKKVISNNKWNYNEFAELYIHKLQEFGLYRIESGILKLVPKSEREHTAK